MDTLTMLFLLFVGCLLWAGAEFLKMRSEVRHLRAHILELESQQNTIAAIPDAPSMILEATTLLRAGEALKNPPTSLEPTLERLRAKNERYHFPLGWYNTGSGAKLNTGRFVGDVNHILLTGQSDSGKDNAALNILLSLALTHTPQQVQFAIIDGKGLDWISWQDKAHLWHIAMKPEDIKVAMDRLTNERIARYERLAAAKVKKWDSYTGNDMPMLIVFVSELLLLQNAIGKAKLVDFMNAELTSARAAGIRYIIATQTASNFDTQWRSQISLFMAGYQPLDSQDKPNTGMSAGEIAALGSVAPSALPAPATGASGVFLCLQGANAINVRTSYISDTHADYLLTNLPNKSIKPNTKPQQKRYENSQNWTNQPPSEGSDILEELLGLDALQSPDYVLEDLPDDIAPATSENSALQSENSTSLQKNATNSTDQVSRSKPIFSIATVALPFEDAVIPFSEQQRIIENAQTVSSKRQLSLKLYNVTGGTKFTWVSKVCDALGLLQSGSSAVGK